MLRSTFQRGTMARAPWSLLCRPVPAPESLAARLPGRLGGALLATVLPVCVCVLQVVRTLTCWG